jgi:hypothetical protein
MNYHSRAPIFSATGASPSVFAGLSALPAQLRALAPLIVAGNSK